MHLRGWHGPSFPRLRAGYWRHLVPPTRTFQLGLNPGRELSPVFPLGLRCHDLIYCSEGSMRPLWSVSGCAFQVARLSEPNTMRRQMPRSRVGMAIRELWKEYPIIRQLSLRRERAGAEST